MMREDLQESAYSRKYSGEEVSSIVRKRVGNLYKYIEALEMENTALTTEIKEMKKNERR